MQAARNDEGSTGHVIDQEPGPTEDDAPFALPIPSFASLRAPQRRSAIDLLLTPEQPSVEPDAALSVEPDVGSGRVRDAVDDLAGEVRAPEPGAVPRPGAAPRPAEWGDLLHLGIRLGTCATGLVSRGLTGLRALLRG